MAKQKEKLDYLEHEDVGTMEKETTKYRREEAEEEIKRIASLRDVENNFKSENPPQQENTPDLKKSGKNTLYEKPSSSQKIIVRGLYVIVLAVAAGIIYLLFNQSLIINLQRYFGE